MVLNGLLDESLVSLVYDIATNRPATPMRCAGVENIAVAAESRYEAAELAQGNGLEPCLCAGSIDGLADRRDIAVGPDIQTTALIRHEGMGATSLFCALEGG